MRAIATHDNTAPPLKTLLGWGDKVYVLLPSPEHHCLVRQRALLYDEDDDATYRLVHVGWNPAPAQRKY